MASQQFTSDIFGRTPLSFGGAFAADSAHINLSLNCCDCFGDPITSAGLVTQQLQIQYQQPITRLYELGTQNTYFVAGRPQGSANIARILGPGLVMAELYSCLGNVCNANTNDVCFCIQGGCTGGTESNFEAMQLCLKNVVMQSLGMTVQAQDMLVNEQMSLFFTAMLAMDTAVCPGGAQPVYCDCIPAVTGSPPCGVTRAECNQGYTYPSYVGNPPDGGVRQAGCVPQSPVGTC